MSTIVTVLVYGVFGYLVLLGIFATCVLASHLLDKLSGVKDNDDDKGSTGRGLIG